MESFGFGFDLGVAGSDTSGSTAASLAALLAAGETDALALDFTDMSAWVVDTGTPANDFDGDPNDLLTYTAPSAKYILNASGVLVSGSTIRTEYDANGDPLGVRVEEARTNLILNSNDFNQGGSWGLANLTVTTNGATGPAGASTAMLWTTTSISCQAYCGHSASSGNNYTTSIYAKAGTATYLVINQQYVSTDHQTWFNLSAGTVGTTAAGATARIESLPDGWYRCSVTANINDTSLTVGFRASDGDNTVSLDNGDTFYVFGAQSELGDFATSYIPTTTATVTRAADSGITLATSAYPHSATVNSAMIRYRPLNVAAAMVALRWDDGTSNEVVSVGHSAAAALGLTVTDGGAAQTAPLTDGTATAATWEKVACSWKANDFLFSDNGAAAVADTSGTLPTVTSLDIGPTLSGHISQILVVPAEKSAAEVATMATP